MRVKVEKQLALSDGVAADFGAKMAGAKPGDVRDVEITLVAGNRRRATARAARCRPKFHVKDVKTDPPAGTDPRTARRRVRASARRRRSNEFVQTVLDRRLEYTQRQVARQQVLEKIAAGANWELPQDLLRRQARKTLAAAGHGDEERRHVATSRSRAAAGCSSRTCCKSTAAALKEHFVLQKIAEVEKIEIEDEDLDDEIERIADQSGESFRKVRARMEKEDMMEALATDLLERKALDLILGERDLRGLRAGSRTSRAGEVATVERRAHRAQAEGRRPRRGRREAGRSRRDARDAEPVDSSLRTVRNRPTDESAATSVRGCVRLASAGLGLRHSRRG